MKIKFPKNFLWGAATSAYQVEGGIVNDWTAHFDAKEATRHYQYFRRDLELAKKLNHNAHRFSIEWSRIEPEEGSFVPEELAHYEKLIDELKLKGMEPLVTLWHFTLPLWLAKKGGWACPEAPEHFRRYVEFVVSNLGHKVNFWITLNEPRLYCEMMYLSRQWLEKSRSPIKCRRAILNLARAHRLAYETIHNLKDDANVGVAANIIHFDTANKNPVNFLLKTVADYAENHYFLNKIRDHQDFIGLNYYFHNRINFGFGKNENSQTSDMGWEIYPEGIYYALKRLAQYQKPIIVTENGLADKRDKHRAKFIKEHLAWIAEAMKEGTQVRGYLHWSLLDNFEWAHGFEPRFGLVEIDYKTFRRKIRKSALEYAKICKSGKFSIVRI